MTELERNAVAAAIAPGYPQNISVFATELNEQCFTDQYGMFIYRIIRNLYEAGTVVDIVILHSELEEKAPNPNKQEFINEFTAIAAACAPGVALTTYVEQLLKLRDTRTARRAFIQGLKALENGEDYTSYAASIINASTSSIDRTNVSAMAEITPLVMAELSADEDTGLLTGFERLDKLTHGFRPGDHIIIAAYTGIGKSAIAANMAANMAKAGKNVIYISAEMQKQEIYKRILWAESEISETQHNNCKKLASPEAVKVLNHVMNVANTIDRLPITICDRYGINVGEVESICIAESAKRKIDCIFVDYLQIIESDRKHNQRNDEVAYISRRLRRLAQKMECPIISLAQINREVEKGADHTPRLHMIGESAAIGQDATTVLFLHREKPYNPADTSVSENEAQLFIAKQRNGIGTASIDLDYVPQITRFYDSGKMPNKFKQ